MIKVWYDSETGVVKGFFPEENNYESIPAPTIEITPEQHQEYFDKGQRHIVQQQEDGTLAFVYVEPAAPTADEIKQQKLTALDTEYQPQFDALSLAWATASMDDNIMLADSIKADKADLLADYNTKREEILNG